MDKDQLRIKIEAIHAVYGTSGTAVERIMDLIGPSEDIKGHSVGVISFDIEDFNDWKQKNNFVEDSISKVNKFKSNNNTYRCITKVIDLCSLNVTKIMETEHAKENKQYNMIILYLRDTSLKHNI